MLHTPQYFNIKHNIATKNKILIPHFSFTLLLSANLQGVLPNICTSNCAKNNIEYKEKPQRANNFLLWRQVIFE